MIYVLFNKGQPVHVTSESPYTGRCTEEYKPILRDFFGLEYDSAKCSPDFKSIEEVEAIAAHFNEQGVHGRSEDKPFFLAYDDGEYTSHRFGIVEPPKVGDDVSYGFNGDYYPCGKIVRITKGFRITTSDGDVFNRRKQSSRWVKVGGTWSLVKGIVNERNPSF